MSDWYEELEKFRGEISELEEYSDLMCDHYGEYIGNLCNLLSYMECMNDEFKTQYTTEVREQLKKLKENTRVVDIEEDRQPRTYKKVQWKGVDYDFE